jgi:hypothetical protein
MRRTMLAIALGALIILVTMVGGHLPPPVEIAQPDTHLMPGAPYMPDQTCISLHNGDFQCSNGDDIGVLYSGANGKIQSTTQHAQGETLGDLVLQWGVPDGYVITGHFLVVMWTERDTAAYLQVCALRATSAIWQIEYGSSRMRGIAWRGLIGRITTCDQG